MDKPRSIIKYAPATSALLAVVSTGALASNVNAVLFPGEVSELRSPNGLYSVKNVDKSIGNVPRDKYQSIPSDSAIQTIDHHYIQFFGHNHIRGVVLRSYERDVEVLWSPDSSAFIVNDYVASNLTLTYLYRVNDLEHPVDLSAKFLDSIKDKSDKVSIANSIYVHIIVTKWLGPNRLEIRVKGNSNTSTIRPNYLPFTLVYTWDLKNTFTRIKRTPK